jgi:sporulation protein YlmC with PRC-barrel domain
LKNSRRSNTGCARGREFVPEKSVRKFGKRLKIYPMTGTADVVAGFLPINFISGRDPMLAKFMTAGLVGSALLATVAFAQTQTPPAATKQTPPAATNMAPAAASDSSFHGNWRASKLVGLGVYNDSNESLGSINDLLADKEGNIKAVVIGVGGFLGVGEHLVAIPYDKIKFVNEPVAYKSASNATGSRPGSTTTTGAAPSAAPAAKANPWYPDHAVFSATKDQLKAMPEFKYSI